MIRARFSRHLKSFKHAFNNFTARTNEGASMPVEISVFLGFFQDF